MRMTFAEWIREQKDICDKLKEQNYEDQKEIRNFFNDRIKRIFEIDLPKNKSYERIWGDNRDKNKRMYKALYGELKEDDIKFGEGEQRFFRAIFEIFSQSEDINNLKNNKWELYDLQQRKKLWNIIEDMLEANDSWFVEELGWWGRHWDAENYLMEKIFVPHLYRIRKNLSKLKEEIDLYPEIKDEEYINKAISFEQSLDRYLSILFERAGENIFERINTKIRKLQQLIYGINIQSIEGVVEKNEITQEDVNFEAAIDRYLNLWDMRRNENDCINRILNKIEKIENIWSIYEVKTTYVPIKGLSDEGEGIPSYEKIEFVENKKFEERYKKIVKETELNCEEDEIFEKKLKGYVNFVHRKINKYYKENVFRDPKNDGGKINFLE